MKNFKKKLIIKNQYFLLSIIFITLIIIIPTYISYNYYQKRITKNIEKTVLLRNRNLILSINKKLEKNIEIIKTISEFMTVEIEEEKIFITLKNILEKNSFFSSVYFGTSENKMINGSGWIPPENFDLRIRPWYKLAINKNKIIITDPFLNASKDKRIVTIANPVYNLKNELIGVIGADVWIEDILNMIKEDKISKNSYNFLLNKEREIIIHSKEDIYFEEIYNKLNFKNIKLQEDIVYIKYIEGKKYLIYINEINESEWLIGSITPTIDFIDIKKDFWILFVSIISFLIFFSIFFILSNKKYVIEPIFLLEKNIQKIPIEKDFKYRIEENNPYIELKQTINKLLEKKENYFNELNKIEKELIERKEYLKSLIDNLPFMLFVLDNNGIFLDYKLAEEDLYTKPEFFIGKNYKLIFPKDIVEKFEKAFKKAVNIEDIIIEEYSLMINNVEKFYEARINKIEKIGFLVTCIEITKLKEQQEKLIKLKEEAEKANKAKSEFLSNMSHEIRTPMNGIIGFINILLDKESDEETKEFLEIIKESSNNLLNIINDILSLSKIESGKYKIDKEKINFVEKINSIVKIYEKQSEVKNLKFGVNISKELDKKLMIDYHSILKILNNLLSNAMKFTNEGYILLKINKVKNNKIEILVEDTGIGINEEKQKHLFEAFEQGEHYLTKKYGGTGLGLAIIKKLVELLEGEIGVETELGKGTKIRVSIPYEEVEEKEEKNLKEIRSKFVKKDIKIISAEDVEVNQRLLEISLKNKVSIFKKVYNGEELLKELEKENYDLILMDIQMPVINGIEATKIIKKNSKYKDIPIIAVSAFALEENIERIYESGINDFISKPVKKEELIIKINKWLS